ncbi:hypothetical protein GCM10023166_34500 [Paeniglutamicibacter cryotolerans]
MPRCVKCEVAQSGEPGFAPVQMRAVEGHLGELDMVRRRPVTNPRSHLHGSVLVVVVQEDRDAFSERMQRIQVTDEGQDNEQNLITQRDALEFMEIHAKPISFDHGLTQTNKNRPS